MKITFYVKQNRAMFIYRNIFLLYTDHIIWHEYDSISSFKPRFADLKRKKFLQSRLNNVRIWLQLNLKISL